MQSAEHFQGPTDAVWAQARRVATITPSDSANLALVPKALWISADGTISVIGADDDTNTAVALGSLTAGTVVPIRCKRVMSTGTTATVLGLY